MESQRPNGVTLVCQVHRRLRHVPRFAREANATAIAGIRDKVVVSAIFTPRLGKAMREDAAFQIFAKRLEHIALWGVVVALPVELACDKLVHARFQNLR